MFYDSNLKHLDKSLKECAVTVPGMVGVARKGGGLAQNATNTGVFQIRLLTLELLIFGEPKHTEIVSEKLPDLSHLGPI